MSTITADTPRVAVQAWVSPQLRQTFKSAAHRHGATISEATSEAFELWLAKTEDEDIARSVEVARRHMGVTAVS
jgi:hypothetical protein